MNPREADAMSLPPSAAHLMRWQDKHASIADALIAGVILLATVLMRIGDFKEMPLGPDHTWLYAGAAACVLASIGVALRRRHPVLAWAMVAFIPPLHLLALSHLTSLSQLGLAMATQSFDLLIILIGTPLTLASLATFRTMGQAWLACLVSVAALAVTHLVTGLTTVHTILPAALPFALADVIGTLVGIMMRIQHMQLTTLEERSAREALAREQTIMLAASNERSRIAREMHDVVAHSLAVMITMADGAAAAVERNPAMAKQALEVLGETGRSALADTRRLVGVLRDDPGATSGPEGADDEAAPPPAPQVADEQPSRPAGLLGRRRPAEPAVQVRELPVPEFAPPGTVAPTEPTEQIADLRRQATGDTDSSAGDVPTAPAPESGDLEVLVERFRAAGVPITYEWIGAKLPDNKGLQLTLFRIAQESMTNILRYAPTTKSVRVSVSRHLGTAVLTVDNDAAPGSKPVHGSGKGLIGMRERAAVYGGTVDAGPTDAGWRVRAVLRWDENDEGTSPWQIPT